MKYEALKKIKAALSESCRILPEGTYAESAVFMPLVKSNDEIQFLFEKRAEQISQGGEIAFPGGKIDPSDNSPLNTAIRETVEELGVNEEDIKIEFKIGTLVSPRGVIVHAFVGFLNIEDINNINYDTNEVEKIFTVPLSFFEEHEPDSYKLLAEIKPYVYNEKGEKIKLFPADELNLPKRYHGKWTIKEHSVLVYPTEGEIVWGLTAKLIYEFVKLIKQFETKDK